MGGGVKPGKMSGSWRCWFPDTLWRGGDEAGLAVGVIMMTKLISSGGRKAAVPAFIDLGAFIDSLKLQTTHFM